MVATDNAAEILTQAVPAERTAALLAEFGRAFGAIRQFF